MLAAAGDDWAREVLSAAAAVIIKGAERKLEQLANGAELGPKELHAWGGVMKLANDAETTQPLGRHDCRPHVHG